MREWRFTHEYAKLTYSLTQNLRNAYAWKRECVTQLYARIQLYETLAQSLKEDLRNVQALEGMDLVMRCNAEDELPISNEELDCWVRQMAA
jgi:hypothetical protein